MLLHQQIESPQAGHHKAGRHERGDHGVRVLPQDPGIQQEVPHAREHHLARCADLVADRMLHPGMGGNDEVAGQP